MCSSNCTNFFLTFTHSPAFLLLFTFSSPQTFYLDITLPLSFYLPLFCFIFIIIILVIHSSILYIIFSHKKVVISHSLSLNFLVDFYFYFSCIFILAWYKVLYFLELFWLMGLSFFYFFYLFIFLWLWLLNIIILHYKELKIVYKNVLLLYYIAWFG